MKRKCSFLIDDRIFYKTAVMKTAYLFTGDYYVHMSYHDEHNIHVVVEAKPGINIDDVDKKFGNELLAQMVRLQISTENRAVRELILGRALYSSYVDFGNDCAIDTTNCADDIHTYSLDDIAIDWFEVNENNDPI